jgi:hypothetical protein
MLAWAKEEIARQKATEQQANAQGAHSTDPSPEMMEWARQEIARRKVKEAERATLVRRLKEAEKARTASRVETTPTVQSGSAQNDLTVGNIPTSSSPTKEQHSPPLVLDGAARDSAIRNYASSLEFLRSQLRTLAECLPDVRRLSTWLEAAATSSMSLDEWERESRRLTGRYEDFFKKYLPKTLEALNLTSERAQSLSFIPGVVDRQKAVTRPFDRLQIRVDGAGATYAITQAEIGVSAALEGLKPNSPAADSQVVSLKDWSGGLLAISSDSRLPPHEAVTGALLITSATALYTIKRVTVDPAEAAKVENRNAKARLQIVGYLSGYAAYCEIQDFGLSGSKGIQQIIKALDSQMTPVAPLLPEALRQISEVDPAAFKESYENLDAFLKKLPLGSPPSFSSGLTALHQKAAQVESKQAPTADGVSKIQLVFGGGFGVMLVFAILKMSFGRRHS